MVGKITLTNDHGTFATTGMGLDRVISTYLPASVNDLRAIAEERNPEINYSDVNDVSSFLIMLADMDYPADNLPAWMTS
jgi:hypothetical protein